MNLLFKDLIFKGCVIYIDDILVFGRMIEEHDNNLKLVKKILQEYNLTENLNKRIERVESVKFLGYDIELNKIHQV